MMGGRWGGEKGRRGGGRGRYGRHLAHRLGVDEVLVTPTGGVAAGREGGRGGYDGGKMGRGGGEEGEGVMVDTLRIALAWTKCSLHQREE